MKKLIYNKLTKSRINDLELVKFPGKIVVVVSGSEASRCVDYLLSQPVLGFDTETRPAFQRGVHYKCCLLQVSTDDCCFLFRLNHTGLAPAIVRLLEDTTVTKVGLAWNNDLLSLRQLGEFPAKKFTCVWSDELPAPLGAAGALGSVVHVTAMFGFALAGLVLREVRT